jgi:membrane associated rhomboid family serine protease
MLFFLYFSIPLEDKLKSPKLIYYYILFGILSGLTHILIDNSGDLPLVGASGSVTGISVYYALISEYFLIRTFIFLLMASDVYMLVFDRLDNVSHWCHIGGAISAIMFYIFENQFKKTK